MHSPRPENEPERLDALQRYAILDTPREFEFDALAELAAQLCSCPVGLVSFVDERRSWIKASYGVPPDMTECPRDITVCATTLCCDDVYHVADLTQDPRFSDSPLVVGEPGLRFYCGIPLVNPEGYALGSLCVVDFVPRGIEPAQRHALRKLARHAIAHLELRRQLIEREAAMRRLAEANEKIAAEKARSEALLLNILPTSIADELRTKDRVRPRFYDPVTVLFADFKGFTSLVDRLEPAGVIEELDRHFSAFDEIAATHRLEKLKTIGDAYMAAGGLPEPNETHAIDACLAGLRILEHLARSNRQREKLRMTPWEVRIGINTGPAIAGVVGRHKFTYDIWGGTVNVAERMEACGVPGRVNVAEATWHAVETHFLAEPRGSVPVKNRPEMPMFLVERIRPELSADPAGLVPNERFWSDLATSPPSRSRA